MMKKSTWAVGEAYKASGQYKAGEFIDLHRDLNIHDPEGKYRWQDEEANAPAWVWAMRALGALGFLVGIYGFVLLGLSF